MQRKPEEGEQGALHEGSKERTKQSGQPGRKGPHEGQKVAVLGAGSPADTEHLYEAGTTIGEATTESQAITMAKVAGERGVVIAADGVLFVYRLVGPAGLKLDTSVKT